MPLSQILVLARRHLGGDMESSARVCLADAIEMLNVGRLDRAEARALDSLKYSVGVFHPDYQKAARGAL